MPKRKPKDPDRSPDLPHNWIERHLTRLAAFRTIDSVQLTAWQYRRAQLVGENQYVNLDNEWGTITLGEIWGGPNTTAFFRHQLTIPTRFAGENTYLEIDMDGGETQLKINGRYWQGLDHYRQLVPLGEFAVANSQLDLEMEAFIINYPYDERRHDERDYHRFAQARLVKIDREIETCLFDMRFVLDAYLSLWQSDEDHELEGVLLHTLEEACRALGPRLTTQAEAREAACQAQRILRENIFENSAYQRQGLINICAHSHLDIVYLWPAKETYRKNGRTTSNMLSLMREYPEYIYSQSQPFLYEKLKEHFPELFAEVRQRIDEGRWEVIGALYVEPDGNIPGAESWVRQILHGKRFLREELGVDTPICWLPDVFGMMYTLPQVFLKSGLDYFLTAKLNIWNDTSEFPYDSFRWRGPDGSELLTHFPPTHFAQDFTYANLRRHWRDYRQKQEAGENLFVYGWGDGGGGPTREMVAASSRAKQFPGLPESQIGTAEAFFHRLSERREQLPVWDDELYLEGHRGTYTTKAKLKRLNRKVELLYRDAEIISAFADLYAGPRLQERLNTGWKYILLNQFHDTLPGTHIEAAVPDIEADYEVAFTIGQAVRDDALAHLVEHLDSGTAAGHDLLLLNTLSWNRSGLVSIDLQAEVNAVRIAGQASRPVQHFAGQTWFQAELPSLGWTVAAFEYAEEEGFDRGTPTAQFVNNVAETSLYKIEFDAHGNLASIYDKVQARSVLAGPGNRFQFFEDDPGHKFSAWDIAYHIEEYQYPVEQTSPWQLTANGPYFAVFTSHWRLLNSTLKQEMWLYASNPRIDFKTWVDFRDPRKLLKVAFPLRIRSRTATYDLPFGHIERSTHRNTPWDQAKFEVCGHKWADMSEGNYGVALLNDCKYGYDARENVLRLSLIRSPVRPDGQSDIGAHEFVYSLLPHQGNWRQASVDRHAYELNIPPLATNIRQPNSTSSPTLPATQSLLQVGSAGQIVEVLKQAEAGEGLVLRTFDSHGNHTHTPFNSALNLRHVAETNLLEEDPQPVSLLKEDTFMADFTPYEIKTHRLVFDGD